MADRRCIQCALAALPYDTRVEVRSGEFRRSYRLRVCFHCFEVLECLLDQPAVRSARLPAGRQLRLKAAAAT